MMVLVYAIKDVEARGRPQPGPIARHHDGALGADPLCAYDAAAIVWWRLMAAPGAPFPTDAAGVPLPDWVQRADYSWGGAQIGGFGGDCRRSEPMFSLVRRHGQRRLPYTTSAARSLGRRIVTFADPTAAESDFGGKMFRIGGATEWRRYLGDGSEATIRKRGRWCSEVGRIYTRTLIAEQLSASLRIGGAAAADGGAGMELEAIAEGWAQSA